MRCRRQLSRGLRLRDGFVVCFSHTRWAAWRSRPRVSQAGSGAAHRIENLAAQRDASYGCSTLCASSDLRGSTKSRRHQHLHRKAPYSAPLHLPN